MSGVLLVLVSSINAEYEWNGKEWIWKETPTVSISLTLNQKLQYEKKFIPQQLFKSICI